MYCQKLPQALIHHRSHRYFSFLCVLKKQFIRLEQTGKTSEAVEAGTVVANFKAEHGHGEAA